MGFGLARSWFRIQVAGSNRGRSGGARYCRYEEGDGAPCRFDIFEAAAIDFFGFECLHEALGLGIVVGVAGPAHADGDIVAGEAPAVFGRGILHAAIGMMNETGGLWFTIGKRVIQRLHGHAAN